MAKLQFFLTRCDWRSVPSNVRGIPRANFGHPTNLLFQIFWALAYFLYCNLGLLG